MILDPEIIITCQVEAEWLNAYYLEIDLAVDNHMHNIHVESVFMKTYSSLSLRKRAFEYFFEISYNKCT